MPLSVHRRKHRSGRSPEPPGGLRVMGRRRRRGEPRFVIQHRADGGDHYDLRLEIDGVLVSWAIPKGPSPSPTLQRIARRCGDHPVAGDGDGTPDGGQVVDCGTYTNATRHSMGECLSRGHVSFHLRGDRVHGCYALTRVREGEHEAWLLLRRRDPESLPPEGPPDEHNEPL